MDAGTMNELRKLPECQMHSIRLEKIYSSWLKENILFLIKIKHILLDGGNIFFLYIHYKTILWNMDVVTSAMYFVFIVYILSSK